MMSSSSRNVSTHLMSNIDTDLDMLRIDTPPSPRPMQMERGSSAEDGPAIENGQNGYHRDAVPETPYYDYACHFPLRI
jgi:hypothetical protein